MTIQTPVEKKRREGGSEQAHRGDNASEQEKTLKMACPLPPQTTRGKSQDEQPSGGVGHATIPTAPLVTQPKSQNLAISR